MGVPFKKMQGAGNDFIVMKQADLPVEADLSDLAVKVCHRRFGVGADGILVARENAGQIKMIYYNSDGSPAKMCGNGLRCFARFVYEEGLVKEPVFTVDTMAGLYPVEVQLDQGQVTAVRVNMGTMVLEPAQIPVAAQGESFLKRPHRVKDREFTLSTVLLGVPHTVIFVPDLSTELVQAYGPVLERDPLFPEGTNVNFAQIKSRQEIRVKTWERGAGYTLACGTGIASVFGVAQRLALTADQVMVEADGGKLFLSLASSGEIKMEGPAENICRGELLLV